MRNTPLVVGLTRRLGGRLAFTTGPIPIGCLRADTTTARGDSNMGISIRINSQTFPGDTVPLLSKASNMVKVEFAPRVKLSKHLPNSEETEAYAQVLSSLGLDISQFRYRQKPSLHIEVVLDALDQISDRLLGFCATIGG